MIKHIVLVDLLFTVHHTVSYYYSYILLLNYSEVISFSEMYKFFTAIALFFKCIYFLQTEIKPLKCRL